MEPKHNTQYTRETDSEQGTLRHQCRLQRVPLGTGLDGVRLRADQAAVMHLHKLQRAQQDDRLHRQRHLVALRQRRRPGPGLGFELD